MIKTQRGDLLKLRSDLERAQHDKELLMPKICCQEFETCTEADCVVRLNKKIKGLENRLLVANGDFQVSMVRAAAHMDEQIKADHITQRIYDAEEAGNGNSSAGQ